MRSARWQSTYYYYSIATLWWQVTQHFGLRGRQEHHSMRVEDFFSKKWNWSILHIYAEGITKTRPSGLRQTSRLQLPKMFETQSERCPVKLFQKCLSKLPVGMEKSGQFYLQPIVNHLTNIWYKKTAMGINSINSAMKGLISNSPLQNSQKHLANHSARKTLVKKWNNSKSKNLK